MVHYADLIEIYGPLIYFSNLRFERKHLIFKNIYNSINNSINLTLSLSRRVQRKAAIVPNLKEEIFFSKSSNFFNEDIMIVEKYFAHEDVFSFSFIDFKNSKFRIGKFIVKRGIIVNEFLKLIAIYSDLKQIIFVCDIYQEQFFDDNLYSHLVNKTGKKDFLVENILDFDLIHHFTLNNHLYIRKFKNIS